MTLRKALVRIVVSAAVILVHLFAFFVILFWKAAYASPAERIDAALLLVPVTAAYVLAIGRRAISGQSDVDAGPVVNLEYILFVTLMTFGFLAAMIFTVLAFPSNFIPTIDTLKRMLLIIEIGVGSAFGLIVEDLFGKVERITVPTDQRT